MRWESEDTRNVAECSSQTSEVWKVDKVAGRQQVVVVGGVAKIAPHLNQQLRPKIWHGCAGTLAATDEG